MTTSNENGGWLREAFGPSLTTVFEFCFYSQTSFYQNSPVRLWDRKSVCVMTNMIEFTCFWMHLQDVHWFVTFTWIIFTELSKWQKLTSTWKAKNLLLSIKYKSVTGCKILQPKSIAKFFPAGSCHHFSPLRATLTILQRQTLRRLKKTEV